METNNLIIGKRKGISNWFRQFVTVIDPENKRYKIQEGLFGIFRWGDFEPLPRVDYALIFRQFFAKCEACTFDENDDNNRSYFQVSLVYNKNRRIVVHEDMNRETAFRMAGLLAGRLNVKVRDSASRRGKSVWLDPVTQV